MSGPPGAIWPRKVASGFVKARRCTFVIGPETRGTQNRGPVASMQARAEPEPESVKFVMRKIRGVPVPPRPDPPGVDAPGPSAFPSAPWNAGQFVPEQENAPEAGETMIVDVADFVLSATEVAVTVTDSVAESDAGGV